jgi:hypothetical protein
MQRGYKMVIIEIACCLNFIGTAKTMIIEKRLETRAGYSSSV